MTCNPDGATPHAPAKPSHTVQYADRQLCKQKATGPTQCQSCLLQQFPRILVLAPQRTLITKWLEKLRWKLQTDYLEFRLEKSWSNFSHLSFNSLGWGLISVSTSRSVGMKMKCLALRKQWNQKLTFTIIYIYIKDQFPQKTNKHYFDFICLSLGGHNLPSWISYYNQFPPNYGTFIFNSYKKCLKARNPKTRVLPGTIYTLTSIIILTILQS